MAKDAFGVDREEVTKAWKGEKGDKRNTKYFGSYLAGDVTGTQIGRALGGGYSAKGRKARRNVVQDVRNNFAHKTNPLASAKDVERVMRASKAGMIGGLGAGAGAASAYYVYRQSEKGKAARAASIKQAKVSKAEDEGKESKSHEMDEKTEGCGCKTCEEKGIPCSKCPKCSKTEGKRPHL